MNSDVITKEQLETEMAYPGEDYELDSEMVEAIAEVEAVRVEDGVGDPERLAGLLALVVEMRQAEGA